MKINKKFYKPIVGTDLMISPNFKLYNIVVFPAPSRPNINIL